MKYSQLFGKTNKSDVADTKFISHALLQKGGFIAESVAGRYFFLPLGWRVHEKIKAIIRDVLNAAACQEMLSPTLHPIELWRETNRTNTTGFELLKVTDRRGAEFALGGTAEEMFVDVVRKFKLSYKDLPFNLYQFSTKFRDELRARGGLLRVREFVMKDAYSFDRDETAFKAEYVKMAQAYTEIFRRCGLSTLQVESDNGYIGGEYCHEFVVEHPEGESVFFTDGAGYAAHEDIAVFDHEPVNPDDTLKPLQIIAQPAWVKSIDDAMKHYNCDGRHCLKNVVFRTRQGDIVIAVIRGDLEVNQVKLEHVLNLVGQLEPATAEDLKAIGTEFGHVHSWGHDFLKPRQAKTENRDCRVVYAADHSLHTVRNMIGGQKESATDSINVNYGRDFRHSVESDIATAKEGFLSQGMRLRLRKQKGIEVGNIFQLGYHYTKLMAGATFTDSDGKDKPFYMGCYGIGLGRTLAAIVECNHDDKGVIWPSAVAPYQVHLISLAGAEEYAQEIYALAQAHAIEILWDDRPASAGVKLADADLIGCPIRLVVSKRTGTQIEFKRRNASEARLIAKEDLLGVLAANG